MPGRVFRPDRFRTATVAVGGRAQRAGDCRRKLQCLPRPGRQRPAPFITSRVHPLWQHKQLKQIGPLHRSCRQLCGGAKGPEGLCSAEVVPVFDPCEVVQLEPLLPEWISTGLVKGFENRRVLDIGAADGDLGYLFARKGCVVDFLENPQTNYNDCEGIRKLGKLLRFVEN